MTDTFRVKCRLKDGLRSVRRHLLGMTQQELARLLRIGRTAVCRIELGERQLSLGDFFVIRQEAWRRGLPWCDWWLEDGGRR